jgi:hypothetical protein
VPEGAVFVGGEDGGVYLVCRSHQGSPHLFHCTVYDDFRGRVLEQGVFALAPSGDFDPASAEAYGGWTLGIIYLRDGRELEALPEQDIRES